jgi:hypothetical protein
MPDLDVPSRDDWDDPRSTTAPNVRRMSAPARHDSVVAKARHAYHDNVDLGGPALAKIAKDFALTLDELRRLV